MDPIWLVVGVVLAPWPTVAAVWLCHKSIHTLVRAVVAENPQDFAKLERPPAPVKRQAPEHETDFTESRPRPLGL